MHKQLKYKIWNRSLKNIKMERRNSLAFFIKICLWQDKLETKSNDLRISSKNEVNQPNLLFRWGSGQVRIDLFSSGSDLKLFLWILFLHRLTIGLKTFLDDTTPLSSKNLLNLQNVLDMNLNSFFCLIGFGLTNYINHDYHQIRLHSSLNIPMLTINFLCPSTIEFDSTKQIN